LTASIGSGQALAAARRLANSASLSRGQSSAATAGSMKARSGMDALTLSGAPHTPILIRRSLSYGYPGGVAAAFAATVIQAAWSQTP